MLPNKKIRIAIVRQKYTPLGGAERFVQNMLDALQKHLEVELTLITREWAQQPSNKIRIIECNPFYLGRLWRDWSFAKKACQAIKQHRHEFDLVQSHERIPCADVYRAGEGVHREWLMQRQRVRPWWNRIWDRLSPYHRYLLRQERLVFESTQLSALVTNSNTTKMEIERHFPNHNAPITVIPNAVDQERFHPRLQKKHREAIRNQLSIPLEHNVSLFVGSGYERKGVAQLLKVFEQLNDKQHLIIIGKDKHQYRFEEKAKKLGITRRVHFLGPQTDIRPYLGASDLFVFPSMYDPLPNSTLEAAASGLPVIASKTTGAADLTENAPDPLDINAWIHAIQLTSLHLPPSINLTENTQQAMSDKLLTLYQKIMRDKGETL